MAKVGSLKLAIAVGIVILIFIPPFAKYQELCDKNRRMKKRIAFLTAENKKLEERRRRLETDITYIERRAREKTGVVRKGEIVIKEAPAPAKR